MSTYRFSDVDSFIQMLQNIESRKEREDWMYNNDQNIVGYIEKPKYLCFAPHKKRVSVDHYVTLNELLFKSMKVVDMHRKHLFEIGNYELEDGEIFE